mmetsp:Transcript_20716/g.31665  ORF Transcript_20716/g.31665 Transcript_20716/m.31665 type:complete len:114 (+) Transcript_20716:418-759(+)
MLVKPLFPSSRKIDLSSSPSSTPTGTSMVRFSFQISTNQPVRLPRPSKHPAHTQRGHRKMARSTACSPSEILANCRLSALEEHQNPVVTTMHPSKLDCKIHVELIICLYQLKH